jgi:hypothetical protein
MLVRSSAAAKRLATQKRMQIPEVALVHKREAAMSLLKSFGITMGRNEIGIGKEKKRTRRDKGEKQKDFNCTKYTGVDNPKHFKLFRVALHEDEEDVMDLGQYRRIRDHYLLLVEIVDTAAGNLHSVSFFISIIFFFVFLYFLFFGFLVFDIIFP